MIDAVPKVTGIDATYYLVVDLQRATNFYNGLLGMQPTMHMEGMVSEWTFPGGETFGLYKYHDEKFDRSSGVMFAVADLDAAVSGHKARGVQIDGDITDTPVCRMAFGKDTEGNSFILHQLK